MHGEWVLDEVLAAGGRVRRAADVPRLPARDRPRPARRSSERVFDIERWEEPDYGGHFPALEATDVLADSLLRFTRR